MNIKKNIVSLLLVMPVILLAQTTMNTNQNKMKEHNTMQTKVKVEIWSDVVCPFCYIGKRKFEEALERFPFKDSVEIVWRSFQLNPQEQYIPGRDIYTYLADKKGQTREWSVNMHNYVTEMAKGVGLNYNFDSVKISNSFDAHRIIQLAKKYNLANEAEERFFKAYFIEGAVMSDHSTLLKLALEIGLNKDEVISVLNSNMYADAVMEDAKKSREVGVNGVPFFVVDNQYSISGAQDSEVFYKALNKAYNDHVKK